MTVVQNWKPKPWIAVLLSIVVAPLGLVYAGRPRWAGIFFVATTSIAIAAFFLLSIGHPMKSWSCCRSPL